jgi:hypothetical protein
MDPPPSRGIRSPAVLAGLLIKSPRLKGSKTGGKKALIGLRRPLREEKRETIEIVCMVRRL